jgi:hypothetical protein
MRVWDKGEIETFFCLLFLFSVTFLFFLSTGASPCCFFKLYVLEMTKNCRESSVASHTMYRVNQSVYFIN